MLKGFNEWYLDVDLRPTAEQLEARMRGIEAFVRNGSGESVCELARLYFGIPADGDVVEEFAEYFSDVDPSFSARNREELALLAGATLVYLAEEDTAFGSLAELLCAVLATYRRPASSERILQRLQQQLKLDSIALRAANMSLTDAEDAPIDGAIDRLSAELGEEAEWSSEIAERLITILKNLSQAEEDTILELRNELSVMREDSQILWWMTGQWSNYHQTSLKQLDKGAACLIIGVEAAEFVKNFPGPSGMKAVLYHVIGNCKGKSAALPLTDVIRVADNEWKQELSDHLDENRLLQLLPIHTAIVRSQNTTSDEQWYPKFCEDVLCGEAWQSASPQEYAWRTYLEELTLLCFDSL